MVGDLPEVVEEEIDGDPAPVEVKLPVTVNGRIFPRENIDVWSFAARKGQVVSCEVFAERIGSPLDSRLEVRGPDGRVIAENDDAHGADSFLRFTAASDGKYQVRIHDTNRNGGPRFIYRLTLTADPYVTHVYPLGGRRGTKTRFTLSGGNVPAAPVEAALPVEKSSAQLQRFSVAGKMTNAVALDLDDLPEVLEAEPNDSIDKAQRVSVPAVLNGRIDRPGDMDCWSFTGRKGEAVSVEMRGYRYGSPLRAVLEVVDEAGKSLAQAGHQRPAADPALSFTPPRDGVYILRVRDYFRNRGGSAFAYRVRLTLAAPDFQIEPLLSALTVVRGGKKANLRLTVRRQGGFNGAIALSIEGLPAGVVAAPLTVRPGQGTIDVGFTAGTDAAIAVSRLSIRGTATAAGKTIARPAILDGRPEEHPIDNVLLAVALAAPFKIVGTFDLRLAPRGTVFRKHFKIERNGFTGPLEVRLADRQARHLQGVTGPVLTILAGVEEIDYPVTLPPWMETGRTSRACVMAVGKVRDGGIEHVVSYSSQAQADQIIAVVETGRLGLELRSGSVAAKRGGAVDLPVSIRRGKGLSGPVKIELILPPHVRGLSAAPLLLDAKESAGKVVLKFGDGPVGPFNMPVVVRATLTDASGPVTAEGKLEIVTDQE